MTCFWDGILAGLTADEKKQVRAGRPGGTPARALAEYLKSVNTVTQGTKVNGRTLTAKEMQENVEWVRSYNSASTGAGYFCSTSDPFLILSAHVFKVSIDHSYNGSRVLYSPARPTRTIRLASNRNHLWHVR